LITARYFSSCPSDSTSRWTPCPPETHRWWLQVRLGCFRLSLSCPFRLFHTFHLLRPARHYPRVRIWRSSFERQRDFNPPEQRAAQRTLRGSPPLAGASVLSASRGYRLCLFPSHHQPGSQVPYESPDEIHAAFTPDTAWPVSRYLPCSIPEQRRSPVSMSPDVFRCVISGSFALVSLIPT
jgi:hypothetical protein